MCYSTKKKIADCVRQLMKRKEISKITIGDIMEATGMSRQSFYYHFKDIYDVLEWIGCNDFKDQLQGQYDSMEKWACDLMEVLQRERSFYEKLANELAWPMIVRGVRMALDAQVRRLLLGENPGMFEKHPEELEAVTSFLSSGNIPLSIFHGTSITRYRKTEASFSTPSRSRASVPGSRQRWTANTATKTDSSTWMRSKASFRSSTGSIPRQP